MPDLTELQRAILDLSEADYARLRDWLADADWKRWDRQFEADVKAGRLDFLLAEVREAKERGTLRTLGE